MSDEIETQGDDFDTSYPLFIEEALATGCVWGLENNDGWALCSSVVNDDIDVIPLWSQPEGARAHCVGEWSEYKPVPIALDEFLDDWLPGMHEDLLFIGTNWNSDLEGPEVEPLDLLEDIDEAASDLPSDT